MSLHANSSQVRGLKAILDNIDTDPAESGKGDLFYPRWLEVKSMSDNYEIDAEYADELLPQEKPEGQAMSVGSIQEGFEKRYISRTYARQLRVSQEALEDAKYDKIINAAKRLTRNAYKGQDLDATNMFLRSTNSSYVGGDGVCLGSSAHTLAYGGTWSNIAGTYQTPSRAALIAARTKVGQYPGHSGIIEPRMIKKIVCPLAQELTWWGILNSDKVPESNANEMNAVKAKMKGVDVVAIPYIDGTTTTAWACVTDADNGVQWRNRKKLETSTWVSNEEHVMNYSVRYRSTNGWTNARTWYQGNT